MVATQPVISADDVKHTAELANLKVAPAKLDKFQVELESILQFVKTIQTEDTTGVQETTQVTGLENVWREDVVDSSRTFTQAQALSNAKSTHQGFFMVKAILEDA